MIPRFRVYLKPVYNDGVLEYGARYILNVISINFFSDSGTLFPSDITALEPCGFLMAYERQYSFDEVETEMSSMMKDKYDVEIFEGDVVKINYHTVDDFFEDNEITGIVKIENGQFRVFIDDGTYQWSTELSYFIDKKAIVVWETIHTKEMEKINDTN